MERKNILSYHTTINFTTKVDDIIRIDNQIESILNKSDLVNGIVTAFVPGSTGSLSTIEYEPGLIADFPSVLSNLVPSKKNYQHNKLNYDDNGHSHIKSTIIGPSITIPFINKRLRLGTWQQIVFLEFDTHPRNRTVEIMILGTNFV